MKTKKAAAKRFNIIGTLHEKRFKYKAVGHRHLNRNKSWRNRKAAKRPHFLTAPADIKKMKRLLPYWKKKRSLRI